MDVYDAINIICDIRMEEFPVKGVPIAPSEYFRYHSYCRWALDELEQTLWKNRECKDVLYFLEGYRQKMDDWACLPGKPSETCWMYAIAYEITTHVIDNIIIVNEAIGI